jgi:hypothetical protein
MESLKQSSARAIGRENGTLSHPLPEGLRALVKSFRSKAKEAKKDVYHPIQQLQRQDFISTRLLGDEFLVTIKASNFELH